MTKICFDEEEKRLRIQTIYRLAISINVNIAEQYVSWGLFSIWVTNCFAMQSFSENTIAVYDVKLRKRPMPLTSQSWVQITASLDNFARLARQIKSELLR